MDIRFLGHACFELTDGDTRVLIDPFLSGNPKAAADPAELEPTHIFLTHGHPDHYGDIEEIAKRTGAPVVAIAEIAGELGEAGMGNLSDPNLGDIDLVSRTPRPKMFTFSTNQSLYYTTNAFLAQSGEQDAFFYNGRIDASFVPYAVRDFTPRLTFEQNFFRYSRFSRLDFDSQTLQLDLKYDLNHNDTWFVNGSYGVSRLYSPRGSTGEQRD